MIFDKVLDGSAEVRVDPVVLVQDGSVQGGVVSEDRHQLDMINWKAWSSVWNKKNWINFLSWGNIMQTFPRQAWTPAGCSSRGPPSLWHPSYVCYIKYVYYAGIFLNCLKMLYINTFKYLGPSSPSSLHSSKKSWNLFWVLSATSSLTWPASTRLPATSMVSLKGSRIYKIYKLFNTIISSNKCLTQRQEFLQSLTLRHLSQMVNSVDYLYSLEFNFLVKNAHTGHVHCTQVVHSEI